MGNKCNPIYMQKILSEEVLVAVLFRYTETDAVWCCFPVSMVLYFYFTESSIFQTFTELKFSGNFFMMEKYCLKNKCNCKVSSLEIIRLCWKTFLNVSLVTLSSLAGYIPYYWIPLSLSQKSGCTELPMSLALL